MTSLRWILFVARRYLRERRSNRALAANFLSVAGIAAGVMTLVVVIGVMNGFQLGFIEDILEIRSYDLRIGGLNLDEAGSLAKQLEEEQRIKAAVPFIETQTLVQGRFSEFEAAEVRGVPADMARRDPGFLAQLGLEAGSFDTGQGLILGRELARAVGVRLGDTVTLAALTGTGFAGLVPESREYTVTGLFRSGFYEYDRGLIFTSLENMQELASAGDRPVLGIKLQNRYRLDGISGNIDSLLAEEYPQGELVSWREFNRAFFGALRMEKTTMSLLIGVMFLVVAGNIYHSLRRGVQEKRTAIAVLRAVGGGSREIQSIFIMEGFLIGLVGTAAGLSLGLLVVTHIEALFTLLELVSNLGAMAMAALTGTAPMGGLSISPAAFYLTHVPVRIIPREIVLIAFFALSASVLSAWGASRDIASLRPSSILRYE